MDTDPKRLQAVLLAAAVRLLEAVDGAQTGPVRVTVGNGRLTLEVVGEGQTAGWPGSDEPGAAAARRCLFTPREREIVLCLAAGPLPGYTVARRLGTKYSSTLKALLANLVERHVLRAGRDGYAVTDHALVEIARRADADQTR